MNTTKPNKTKVIASCGMLTAVAVVLQYMEIPLPFMPSFIKLDFSDLPELIAAYAFGPVAGVIVTFVKNLIHMAVSQSGYVGELSNALLGMVLVVVTGNLYKLKNSKTGALVSGIVGSAVMAIASFPINLFLIYPLYYTVVGFPEPAVLKLYQVIMPSLESVRDGLLIFNVPFTLGKGIIDVLFCIIIYERIIPAMKKLK